MKNRGLLIFGGVLILLGILSLIENIFHIDFGAYFFPLILIGIGVWLLVRPRLEAPGRLRFIGDMNRSGPWEVTEEEHTVFVGDTRMDFTQATLPEGETRIVLNGFVGDIRVIVPRDMAVRLLCQGFTHTIHWFGSHQDNFLTSYDASTVPDYGQAARRLCLDVNYFVTTVRLKYPD